MNSALVPVSQALFKVLNVPSLVGPYQPNVCAGARAVRDSPTVSSTADFPFVWYELAAEDNRSGLGRGPWLLELDVRIHTFSTDVGMAEGERITTEIVRLVRQKETGLVVAGWSAPYQPHDRIVLLPFEQLAGIKVTELVTMGRLYVEEAA